MINLNQLEHALTTIQEQHNRISAVHDSLQEAGLELSMEDTPIWNSLQIEPMISVVSIMLSNDTTIQKTFAEDISWWIYDKPKGPSEVIFQDGTTLMVDDNPRSCANYILYQLLRNS